MKNVPAPSCNNSSLVSQRKEDRKAQKQKIQKIFLHLAATVLHLYPRGRKTGRAETKKMKNAPAPSCNNSSLVSQR
jgi:hypothetical protein